MNKLFILLLLVPGIRAGCQELSHIQYTVRDGLPGSIVYQCLQDKNGFIWFCTNQGVSRFDGKTFRNFSKENGLPDNEILKLYLDAYGDIWFISLQGIPSVLYEGRIRRMDDCKGVYAVAEDFVTGSIFLLASYIEGGTRRFGYYRSSNAPGRWSFEKYMIALDKGEGKETSRIFIPRASSEKIGFCFAYGNPGAYILQIQGRNGVEWHSFPRKSRHYLPFDSKSFVSLAADKCSIFFFTDRIYLADSNGLHPLMTLKELRLRYLDLNDIYCENDSTLWLCSRNRGLVRVKNFRNGKRQVQSYFPEAFCTSILKDREGGYWVTTHDDGVYYLPGMDMHYLEGDGHVAGQDVKCIRAAGRHTLVSGLSNGNILLINGNGSSVQTIPHWGRENKNNRVLDISPYGADRWIVASDYGIYRLASNGSSKKIAVPNSIKSIFCQGDSVILFTSADGLFREFQDIGGLRRDRCLFPHRTTCVAGIGNNYYWGTLNGLYGRSGNSVRYWGNVAPPLSGIINHIDMAPDSSVWVSTQQGVVILRNGYAISIGRRQGLLSDMCKNVSIDGNVAWVSTDKGISRVSFKWAHNLPDYTTSDITENDGLISNDVNQTAILDGYIWAATARGISWFPINYIPHSMQNPLVNIDAVISGNREFISPDTVTVDYRSNKLTIGLSGISFRSEKNITYQYRLRDLDSNWVRTGNNLLEFSTLPFGTHSFEVRVLDRWGTIGSQVRHITILVPPPFWKTLWFLILTYLFTAVLMGAAMHTYLRLRHRTRDRAFKLRRKMADLEMMALRSQMNPHFIFNCLSSIQSYILRADVKNANLYLHKFSTLIRKILQHSVNSYTTLAEELSILGLYMELEKLRLPDRMDYSIEVADDLHPADILIPSLIIQPFVENSIKHGISPLEGERGMVRVDLRRSGKYLVCTIADNGVGITASRQENAGGSPEHHSLGLDIIAGRIKVINAIRKDGISVKITDQREGRGEAHGTLVQICFLL